MQYLLGILVLQGGEDVNAFLWNGIAAIFKNLVFWPLLDLIKKPLHRLVQA